LSTRAPRNALFGGVAGLLATCVGVLVYGAVDMNSYSPAILIYAPLWQSLVGGLAIGMALGAARTRMRLTTFVLTAVIVAGALAYVMGEWSIGHSPHFSHDRAVICLVVAWMAGALICTCLAGVIRDSSLRPVA
jgi:peptidoglycan/LPS O-acetylase OafA/YrhL